MTITQLEYVLAIARYQQFGQAAAACGITQPTLSMQVRKLEEEIDILIFDRSKQPVVPTEAGLVFMEQARRVIREYQQLLETVGQLKGSLQGALKVGIIPTLAPYLLPYVAGVFARTYPAVRLKWEELPTEEIVARLKTDRLDAGILVTPLHEEAIRERVLFYEEIFLYVNPEHDLSQLSEVPAKVLNQARMWLLTSGHCFRHQVLNLCGSASKPNQLPFQFEGGSLETLRRLVDTEGGFTLLPELATQELNEEQQQNLRPLLSPKPLREVSLVHARTQAKKRMLEALESVVLEHLPTRLQQRGRGLVVEWR